MTFTEHLCFSHPKGKGRKANLAPDAVAQAAGEIGMRGWLSDPYLWDFGETLALYPALISPNLMKRVPCDHERSLKELGGQLHRNADDETLIKGHVSIYGEATASDALRRWRKPMSEPRKNCDVLIKGAYLITVDASRRIIPDGAMAIVERRIEAVGKSAELVDRYEAKLTLDAEGGVVHPGFVEPHIHISQFTSRTATSVFFRANPSCRYAEWKANLFEEDEVPATALGCLRLIQAGFTSFVDPGTVFAPDAVADPHGFFRRLRKDSPIHLIRASKRICGRRSNLSVTSLR